MSYILHVLEGLHWTLRLPYEAIKRLFKDDKAISPVIAVLLMVALTVVLSAVVAWIMMSYTDLGALKATSETITKP